MTKGDMWFACAMTFFFTFIFTCLITNLVTCSSWQNDLLQRGVIKRVVDVNGMKYYVYDDPFLLPEEKGNTE